MPYSVDVRLTVSAVKVVVPTTVVSDRVEVDVNVSVECSSTTDVTVSVAVDVTVVVGMARRDEQ